MIIGVESKISICGDDDATATSASRGVVVSIGGVPAICKPETGKLGSAWGGLRDLLEPHKCRR